MFLRIHFVLVLNVIFLLMACSAVTPQHDEVLPLTPGHEKDGGSSLRTQTLWTDDSEVVLMQVMKIGEHPVGVNNMYHNEFHTLPKFPDEFSFGKRLIVMPPGNYDILMYYKREGRYLIDAADRNNSGYLSFKTSVPENSVCVFVPDVESLRVDVKNPKIRLQCRKGAFMKQSEDRMFF